MHPDVEAAISAGIDAHLADLLDTHIPPDPQDWVGWVSCEASRRRKLLGDAYGRDLPREVRDLFLKAIRHYDGILGFV